MAGYGESPCFLIDRLLNRYLTQIDYSFKSPSYPEDSDGEIPHSDSDAENEKHILFPNQINTTSTNVSDTPQKRKIVISRHSIFKDENISGVTKTNFFSNHLPEVSSIVDDDREMINADIDPEKWEDEVRRNAKLVKMSKTEKSELSEGKLRVAMRIIHANKSLVEKDNYSMKRKITSVTTKMSREAS